MHSEQATAEIWFHKVWNLQCGEKLMLFDQPRIQKNLRLKDENEIIACLLAGPQVKEMLLLAVGLS